MAGNETTTTAEVDQRAIRFPGPADGPSHVDESVYASVESFLARIRSRVEAGDVSDAELQKLQQFVYREARLLDLRRYEDWISLFADKLVYWVPNTHATHRLQRASAINFDDRRRLLDRIAYTATGVQCAQIPPSRTCRAVTNIEAWRAGHEAVEIRSNVTIWEHRRETNCFAGVQAFRLLRDAGGYLIETRIVDLVDSIQPQGNNSFII
jgi:3-phenylpropionate/cinnamic acid dioxygenase small subunit